MRYLGGPFVPIMGDDDETYLHITYASHLDMNAAFCAAMHAAIAAGLESAPIGVVTTPGTQHPNLAGRYAAYPSPLPTTTDR